MGGDLCQVFEAEIVPSDITVKRNAQGKTLPHKTILRHQDQIIYHQTVIFISIRWDRSHKRNTQLSLQQADKLVLG